MQTMNTLRNLESLRQNYGEKYLKKPKVYLPPPVYDSQSKVYRKKTLIFDLDETMIHCLDEKEQFEANDDPDMVITIPIDDPDASVINVDADINVRPHLLQCLNDLSKYYQLVVFTASEASYADAILNRIDPDKKLFSYRLYRQHCIETSFTLGGSTFIKDLRIIANRDLKDIIIVDNAVLCFALQIDNGIPILPFYTDKNDDELLHLVYYL